MNDARDSDIMAEWDNGIKVANVMYHDNTNIEEIYIKSEPVDTNELEEELESAAVSNIGVNMNDGTSCDTYLNEDRDSDTIKKEMDIKTEYEVCKVTDEYQMMTTGVKKQKKSTNENESAKPTTVKRKAQVTKDSNTPKRRLEDSQEKRMQTEDETPQQSQQQFPAIWSPIQYRGFQKKYEWLFATDGKLGCQTCKEVRNMDLPASRGVKVAVQWANYQISSYGVNKVKKLTSLRKKMLEHSKSKAHQEAKKVRDQVALEILSKINETTKKEHSDTTNIIFRTAYYVAKNKKSSTTFEEIIDLQISNGVNMGRVMQSRPICVDIIEHIAQQMRKNIISEIIKCRSKITVLLDESIMISGKTCLIVFLKCSVDGKNDPVVFFLDLIELDNTSAVYITEMLLKCLDNHGLSQELLSNMLISFCSDGANVILGIKSGIGKLLQQKFPNVILWHCMNYRLELAVDSALKSCGDTNDFKDFIDGLYTLYRQSPRNIREVQHLAKDLDISLKKISRVFSVQWIASTWRVVNAVWDSFSDLAKYLHEASIDNTRDFRERIKFESLHKKLCSRIFVKNLGLMLDVLTELKNLSVILQQKNITIPKADDTIKYFIKRIESLKTFPGEYSKKSQNAIETNKFNEISLKHQGKHEINNNQFIQEIVKNLIYKLFTTICQEEHNKNTDKQNADKCKDLLRNMSFLDPEQWDEYEQSHFGDTEISDLANLLKINKKEVKLGFIEYKKCAGRFIPETLKYLTRTVETLPANNADCERGFSCMNIIATECWSQITVKHISDLMFISIIGPPSNKFDPMPYVKTWLGNNNPVADSAEAMQSHEKESDCYANLWKIL